MRVFPLMGVSLLAAVGLFLSGHTPATADGCRRLNEQPVRDGCYVYDGGWVKEGRHTCWCSACQGSHGVTGCYEVQRDDYCLYRKPDGEFGSIPIFDCLGQGYACKCGGSGSGSGS